MSKSSLPARVPKQYPEKTRGAHLCTGMTSLNLGTGLLLVCSTGLHSTTFFCVSTVLAGCPFQCMLSMMLPTDLFLLSRLNCFLAAFAAAAPGEPGSVSLASLTDLADSGFGPCCRCWRSCSKGTWESGPASSSSGLLLYSRLLLLESLAVAMLLESRADGQF